MSLTSFLILNVANTVFILGLLGGNFPSLKSQTHL